MVCLNIYFPIFFSCSDAQGHYDLKISPADDRLYIAHAEKRQVWRLLSEDADEIDGDYAENFEVIVGNGERCIPGDDDVCGDGGPAKQARLSYPKGIAIAVDKTMYISDSRNIRVVSPEGEIDTLIGHHGPQTGPPRPLKCKDVFEARDVQLQWPTKLALNPLDSTLHIVDDTLILRLTTDMRVQVIAGKSTLCNLNKEESEETEDILRRQQANSKSFGPILDLAFSPDGQLYMAEKRPNPKKTVINVIDVHGTVEPFAGEAADQEDCLCKSLTNCSNPICSRSSNVLSTQIQFGSLSALAVSPDDSVHVADNDFLQIVSLRKALPKSTKPSGDITLADTVSKELYTFNRYGQHVQTHSLETGGLLYSFVYSKNTVYGRLTVITDALGNKIGLQRDYTNRVQSIENTYGQKFAIKLSRFKHLEEFQVDARNTVQLKYRDNSGLLESKTQTNGDFTLYSYDPFGRVREIVSASGESVQLSTVGCPELAGRHEPKLCVKVWRDGDENDGIISEAVVHQTGKVDNLDSKEAGGEEGKKHRYLISPFPRQRFKIQRIISRAKFDFTA